MTRVLFVTVLEQGAPPCAAYSSMVMSASLPLGLDARGGGVGRFATCRAGHESETGGWVTTELRGEKTAYRDGLPGCDSIESQHAMLRSPITHCRPKALAPMHRHLSDPGEQKFTCDLQMSHTASPLTRLHLMAHALWRSARSPLHWQSSEMASPLCGSGMRRVVRRSGLLLPVRADHC